MAWTSPRTWAAAETVTAALFNQHIRDNLKAIGDAWTAYTPTIANVTTTSVVANHISVGKLTMVRFKFTITAAPTGIVTMTMPVTASTAFGFTSALGSVIGLRTGVSFQTGVVNQASSTTVTFISHGGGGGWAAGVPVAWANTDVWSGSFTYEAA